MKNKKYYIVVSVPKPNRQIGETEVILIPVANICINAHFLGIAQALQ
jgi:hypothetical protein